MAATGTKQERETSEERAPITPFIWVGVVFLVSCTANSIVLESQDAQLIQVAGPAPQRFGVVSDIHGDVESLDFFLERFREWNVDMILVAGDLVLNEELRYGRKDVVQDEEELRKVLNHLSKAGVPVLVVPGNHETKSLWRWAGQYKNVYDLAQFRQADLVGVNLISFPGYYVNSSGNARFIPEDGFFLAEEEVQEATFWSFKDKDSKAVITHGPPHSSGSRGTDFVPGVGNVGSEALRQVLIRYNVSWAVFGHIHEAGVRGENALGEVKEGQKASSLWLNAAAVVEGRAAVIEKKGSEVAFNTIRKDRTVS